jgi:hypothetical protein
MVIVQLMSRIINMQRELDADRIRTKDDKDDKHSGDTRIVSAQLYYMPCRV